VWGRLGNKYPLKFLIIVDCHAVTHNLDRPLYNIIINMYKLDVPKAISFNRYII